MPFLRLNAIQHKIRGVYYIIAYRAKNVPYPVVVLIQPTIGVTHALSLNTHDNVEIAAINANKCLLHVFVAHGKVYLRGFPVTRRPLRI